MLGKPGRPRRILNENDMLNSGYPYSCRSKVIKLAKNLFEIPQSRISDALSSLTAAVDELERVESYKARAKANLQRMKAAS